jgi:ribosomal 50S subunit-associated protein YjgA (DUF615 family)
MMRGPKRDSLFDSLFDVYEMSDGDKLRKAIREARGEEEEEYYGKRVDEICEELSRSFIEAQARNGKLGGSVSGTGG